MNEDQIQNELKWLQKEMIFLLNTAAYDPEFRERNKLRLSRLGYAIIKLSKESDKSDYNNPAKTRDK